MNIIDLNKKIAELETVNDHLVTEIELIDSLLKEVGFEEGIATMKTAVYELMSMQDVELEELA